MLLLVTKMVEKEFEMKSEVIDGKLLNFEASSAIAACRGAIIS